MDAILARLKSKTYQTAILGAILSFLEAQVGLISQLFPPEYRPYLVMVWPIVMIALREVTTKALSAKK